MHSLKPGIRASAGGANLAEGDLGKNMPRGDDGQKRTPTLSGTLLCPKLKPEAQFLW